MTLVRAVFLWNEGVGNEGVGVFPTDLSPGRFTSLYLQFQKFSNNGKWIDVYGNRVCGVFSEKESFRASLIIHALVEKEMTMI